jgi:hypothetical protein
MAMFPASESTERSLCIGMEAVSGVFARVRSSSLALFRTTSDASLSLRMPKKTEWRKRSSRVHSVNFTSQSTIGLTQTHRCISAAVNPGSRPRPLAGRLLNGQSQCKSAATIEGLLASDVDPVTAARARGRMAFSARLLLNSSSGCSRKRLSRVQSVKV